MDLKDTIIKQLSAPVKRKGTQDYMTDEDGNIVTKDGRRWTDDGEEIK